MGHTSASVDEAFHQLLMTVLAADGNVGGLGAWAGIIAALVAATSALIVSARTRAHERDKQLRERMLLAADDALRTFQEAGRSVSMALAAGPKGAGSRESALSEAQKHCADAHAAAARIALLFHPRSPSRHVAIRTVEALERLYRFAEDPDNQRFPEYIRKILDEHRNSNRSLQSDSNGAMELADIEEKQQAEDLATGLLQQLDPELWEKSPYYRLAFREFMEATELFIRQVWTSLKEPLRDNYSDVDEFMRFGHFTFDRGEKHLRQIIEERRPGERLYERFLFYLNLGGVAKTRK